MSENLDRLFVVDRPPEIPAGARRARCPRCGAVILRAAVGRGRPKALDVDGYRHETHCCGLPGVHEEEG